MRAMAFIYQQRRETEVTGLSTSRIIGMIGVSHIQIFGVISNGFPVS